MAEIVQSIWPRTFELFLEHDFFSVRFSRTEMRVLLDYFQNDNTQRRLSETSENMGLDDKKTRTLLTKLNRCREDDYKHLAPLIRKK